MKAKPLLLHIGTAKTGTTSIQESLKRAQRNGGLGPVSYPLWRSDRNHWRLEIVYPPYDELPRWGVYRHQFPADARRFHRMRSQFQHRLFEDLRRARAAVISWEGLSSWSPELVRRWRSDLESLGFGDFRVALYIRDPAAMYLSHTQQRLKTARTGFVEDPAAYHYPFLRAADTWEAVFPGRLTVRRFPPDQDGDIIGDFGEVFESHFDVPLHRSPIRLNTTLSAEAMQILQDYREMSRTAGGDFVGPDTEVLKRRLARFAETLPQTRPALKADIAHDIRARHSSDGEEIRERYGVDLGLGDLSRRPWLLPGRPTRIDEIVESVDPEISHRLLLMLVRDGLGESYAQRPLLLRLAARGRSTSRWFRKALSEIQCF